MGSCSLPPGPPVGGGMWGGSELQGDLAQRFFKEQAGVLGGCCTASGPLHCHVDAETQRDTVILALLAVVLLSAPALG